MPSFRVLSTAVLLLLVAAPSADQQRIRIRSVSLVGGDTPLSNNAHPRLGMTQSDLATIGARLSTGGEWNTEYQAFVDYFVNDSRWLSTSTSELAKPYWCASYAFVYALWDHVSGIDYTLGATETQADTKAEWGDKAVAFLIDSVDATVPFGSDGWRADDRKMVPFAYDWVYPHLTAGQKTTIVNSWKSGPAGDTAAGIEDSARVQNHESNYPAYTSWNWLDSANAGGYGFWVQAGLATLGDGIQDAWAQSGIDRYEWAIKGGTNSIITKETARSGSEGGCAQSIAYCYSYTYPRIIPVEFAWRTANGISKADQYAAASAGWIRGITPYAVRILRPKRPSGTAVNYRWAQEPHSNYDMDSDASGAFFWWLGHSRIELQGVDDDAADMAAWFLANRTNESVSGIGEKYWVFTRFLGAKNTGRSPTTVGLTPDASFDEGKWHWRTGFASESDAFVQVYAHRFMGSTQGPTGAFAIDYNGPAMPLGHAYNHDLDSTMGGGYNNALVFVDPSRTTLETGNYEYDDYGDVRNYQVSSAVQEMTAGSTADFIDLSTVKYRTTAQDSDGIGYLSLDLARAYNGTTINDGQGNANKVSAYERKIVYVPPAVVGTDPLRMFLFDFATSVSTTFQKRQNFVVAGDPTIDGTESTGPSRANGTTNKLQYANATTISYTQTDAGSTAVWISPLAPSGRTVVQVAYRQGTDLEDNYGITSHSSFSASSVSATLRYVGRYRVEIIPTVSQTTDHFATAIEVAPSASASQTTTEAITGTSTVGGRIGSVVAVHRTSVGSTGTFILPTAGTYTVYVAGLTASSSRTFTPGSSVNVNSQGAGNAASATTSAEGTVKLTIVVSGAGSGAANTVTIS